MFKRLSNQNRFLISSLWIFLMLTLVSSVSLVSLKQVTDDAHHLIDRDLPAMTFLLRLDRYLENAQQLLIHSLGTKSLKLKNRDLLHFIEDISHIDHEILSFTKLESKNKEVMIEIKSLENLLLAWKDQAEQISNTGFDLKVDQIVIDKVTGDLENTFIPVHNFVKQMEDKFQKVQIDTIKQRLFNRAENAKKTLWVTITTAIVLGSLMTCVFYLSIRVRQIQMDRQARDQQITRQAQQYAFRLSTAMKMAEREEDVLKISSTVIKQFMPSLSAEILLADSSHAHIKQVTTTDPETGGPGCTVKSPDQCAAVRNGSRVTFDDSSQFDACPYLKNKDSENACSATCIPITVMGRSVGTLHTISPLGELPDHSEVDMLDGLANTLGDRIGLLRAFAKSANRAATDPLTGLRNRRSFEENASKLLTQGKDFAIAYCDLDHFKQLNDKHGHDAGDRALRLFSRILKETLRPNDLAARWGGEEFVILISELSAIKAVPVLERIREKLAQSLSSGALPVFTVSMGVNDNQFSPDLQLILEAADESLLQAKSTGRNKIVIAGRTDADISEEIAQSKNKQLVDSQIGQNPENKQANKEQGTCPVDRSDETYNAKPNDEHVTIVEKLHDGTSEDAMQELPQCFTQILTENVR